MFRLRCTIYSRTQSKASDSCSKILSKIEEEETKRSWLCLPKTLWTMEVN
jgi:hypothetical protein